MALSRFAVHLFLVLMALVGVSLYFTGVAIYDEAAGGSQRFPWAPIFQWPTERFEADENAVSWAVLVVGSKGYSNYRHQADVCHAYQILKRGGIKDDFSVVFMYDDIAMNELNPKKGVLINHPMGVDVYAGVPKDYIRGQVTAENFYAVLLGDKSAVKGGTRKVVNSKPGDRIFIYFSSHGGHGVLGMPDLTGIYAIELIDVLKKKHASGTYKEMVINVEACESGSLFEGLMPDNLNIYVMTASNGNDESHNRKREIIEQQHWQVKKRTIRSHVMEFGDTGKNMKSRKLYLFQGFDPATQDLPSNMINSTNHMGAIDQKSTELVFLWGMYKSKKDTRKKVRWLKLIRDTIQHRTHLDTSIQIIGFLLFGPEKGPFVVKFTRDRGLPIADDLDCLKSLVRLFETYCGLLTEYGLKYVRSLQICAMMGSLALKWRKPVGLPVVDTSPSTRG